MLSVLQILFLATHLLADTTGPNYKTLNSACSTCTQIDGILNKHNAELSADERVDLALNVAKVIRGMSLKSKPELDQKREIYFAINGSLQVLEDDFDSETVVRLIDLRAQAPKNFDFVFWRFPVAEQKKIAERMQAAKADNLRPKAQIPAVKSVE